MRPIRAHATRSCIAAAGLLGAFAARAAPPADVLPPVLATIRQAALFDEAAPDEPAWRATLLRAYLAANDPHADLLDAEEMRRLRQLQTGSAGGVGMTLRLAAPGHVACLPDADGPARRAGVQPLDEVLAVDGVAMAGRSPLAIAARISGPVGTPVTLALRLPGGAPRQVRIVRAAVDATGVTARRLDGRLVVRIPAFAPATRDAVRRVLLERADASEPLVLDLRGNGGGDFYAALDTAMLFVPAGRPLATLVTRAGTRIYTASVVPPFAQAPLVLWQDGDTASAAELFIGALTGNARAASLGTTTFGKATRQTFFPLPDGSALLLTDARVLPPGGASFEGRGLRPTRALELPAPATRDYLAATHAWLAAQPAPAEARWTTHPYP
jgi:carboxyl-terminal processing protease